MPPSAVSTWNHVNFVKRVRIIKEENKRNWFTDFVYECGILNFNSIHNSQHEKIEMISIGNYFNLTQLINSIHNL